jgi:transposase
LDIEVVMTPRFNPSAPPADTEFATRPGLDPPPNRAQQAAADYHKRKARTMAKMENNQRQRVNAMPITRAHAAGVDAGQSSHWVCIGFTDDPDNDKLLVREYQTHTESLRQLVGWLKENQVTSVAVESTSFYAEVLVEMLEQAGIEVFLVDPSYTKQLKGRPKTDKRDAQWIFRLHSVGLLAGAFRPNEQTRVLRGYLRHRARVVRQAGRHIHHMQMALELMNLKLRCVLDDITGSTGLKILKAILSGVRDPRQLAALRHTQCKHTEKEMVLALDGNYKDEHLFTLKLAYQSWEFHQQQLDMIDAQIAKQLEKMKRDHELPALPRGKNNPKKANSARFDVRTALYYVVGIDLTEMEGIDEMTALTIVSEIGTELSKFKTVGHFCSWLGLCPNPNESGKQKKQSRTRPGVNRTAQALRMGASSLHRSNSALGAYLRRMKSRMGAPAAVTATAHKMARMVYYALKHGMQYVRRTQEQYEEQIKEQRIKALKKKARQLGFTLIENSPTSQSNPQVPVVEVTQKQDVAKELEKQEVKETKPEKKQSKGAAKKTKGVAATAAKANQTKKSAAATKP